jgi:hypothetical protein
MGFIVILPVDTAIWNIRHVHLKKTHLGEKKRTSHGNGENLGYPRPKGPHFYGHSLDENPPVVGSLWGSVMLIQRQMSSASVSPLDTAKKLSKSSNDQFPCN